MKKITFLIIFFFITFWNKYNLRLCLVSLKFKRKYVKERKNKKNKKMKFKINNYFICFFKFI